MATRQRVGQAAEGEALPEHKQMRLRLDQLELDPENPRFGMQAGQFKDQTAILDYLVDNLGVDNLLPSLAINGYFAAEPLVVRKSPTKGMYRVVEGNRRLASCLILAGDERAKNQAKRTAAMEGVKKVRWTSTTEVPVDFFEDTEQAKLLPYLGVRHIVSALPWDSYAKARWISDVIANGHMTLQEIVEVVGDDNKTISRMLEGFHVVNQLREAGLFKPETSVRKGRGSNPAFPFSWVYTLLGYPGVRPYLGLPEGNTAKLKPIPNANLPAAGEVLGFLFGNTEKGQNPSIKDSRKIGSLAAALSNPTKRVLLKQGRSAEEIEELSRAVDEQLAECLVASSDRLGQALRILSEGRITEKMADAQIESALSARRLAQEVHKKLETIRLGESADD